MDMHALGIFTSAKRFHNLCPKRTQGTQLGNLQEEVCPHGETKHYLSGRFIYGQAAFEQSPQISYCRSQRISRLLHIIGPATAVHITAHKDRFESRCMFHRPFGTLRHIAVKAFEVLAVFALRRKFP